MIPDKQHCGHELPAYICDEDNLGDIHDILTAALAGNDLSTLPQRWNQELGIIRSRPLIDRDAALIAQERKKWERERLTCVEDISPEGAAIVQSVKAQERAEVLDELATMYANVPEQFLDGTYRLHSEWRDKINSLRQPGQNQCPAGGCDDERNCPDACRVKKQYMSIPSTDPENVSKNPDEIDTSKQEEKD